MNTRREGEVVDSPLVDPTGQGWWDHMLAGRFEQAWHINDARRAASEPDEHQMWDGTPILGRHIMLRCLHGLGDAIQLLRYAPLLQAEAASLTVEVPPALVELARCFPGIDEVITWGTDAPAVSPAWDLQIEINELPYLFRTTLDGIPAPELPYIRLPRLVMDRVRERFSAVPRPRVGLAWQSSEWDPSRSVSMQRLLEATRPAGVQLISLQTEKDEARWRAAMQEDAALHTANRAGPGLLSLAGVIAELDLVISVDTMVAHLAGALGRPVWLLLQHEADWRWMRDRRDSPWYPTMRLFRQPGPASESDAAWRPVLDEVGRALGAFSFSERGRTVRSTG